MPNNMENDIAFGYYNYHKYFSYRRMSLVYQGNGANLLI